jgi:aspartate carbamoyltransferase catalytic subunit
LPLSSRHLLGLHGVPKEDIQLILDTAVTFREVLERPIKKVPTLQGRLSLIYFMKVQQEPESHSSLPRRGCLQIRLTLLSREAV